MSETHEPAHPKIDLLADLQAGEGAEGLDRPLALSHLQGCTDCQQAVAPLAGVDLLLRQTPVAGPSELEWARMAQRARQQTPAISRASSRVATIMRAPFSWRMVAAAAVVAVLIPATLALLLPPCTGRLASGDMLALDDPGL